MTSDDRIDFSNQIPIDVGNHTRNRMSTENVL